MMSMSESLLARSSSSVLLRCCIVASLLCGWGGCLATPISTRDAASFQHISNTTFEYSSRLPGLQQEKERIVFGLRLLEGIPIDWIQGVSQDEAWSTSFNNLLKEDYLLQANSRVQLTRKGRQFADTVGMRLL
jgi:coproporphyrinogen III oxidase-like Fe-S oxidoreductase